MATASRRRCGPISPGAAPLPNAPPDAVDRFARDLSALVAPPALARPLALAVSGGADSMAMLALATAAWPGCVIAATVDHRLRAGAAAEAAMVADWCRAHAVPHATLAPVVPPGGASLQAQARQVRYALLADWAMAAGAETLATAHHADDQAETFLMRAARGSGPAGLAGIRPVWRYDAARWAAEDRSERQAAAERPATAARASLTIVRPLLGWRRSDLREIATALPFVDDPSNADPRHDRTGMRALLASGPLDPTGLAAAAAHCREVDTALAETVDWLWRTRCLPADAGECRIDPSDLPRELRRRLTRRVIDAVRRNGGITEGRWSAATKVESLLDTLESGGRATQAGVLADASGTIWHFRPAPPRRLP